MISAVILVILTIFLPPAGVFLVAGCGADLLINICLTILGFFPGHIHAFYVEYVYYRRKEQAEQGVWNDDGPAPGIFSRRVQTGGRRDYGTVAPGQGGGVPPAQQTSYSDAGPADGPAYAPPPKV